METQNPIDYLNTHCLNHIFSFLSPRDAIRGERVSLGWQNFVHGWILWLGFTIHFPKWSAPECREQNATNAVIARYKQLARQDHNFQLGYATSTQHERCDQYFVKDDISFWVAGALAQSRTMFAFWQRLSQRPSKPIEVDIEKFRSYVPQGWSPPATLGVVLLGGRGEIFLSFHYHEGLRSYIYCLETGKSITLDIILDTVNCHTVPLFLGLDRMYFIETLLENYERYMIAYDFRSCKTVYRLPLDFAAGQPLGNHFSLSNSSGKELIFYFHLASSPQPSRFGIFAVIDGENGHILYKLDYEFLRHYRALYTTGNSFVISSRPFIFRQPTQGQITPPAQLILLSELLYHSHAPGFSFVSTDIIICPNSLAKYRIHGSTRRVFSINILNRECYTYGLLPLSPADSDLHDAVAESLGLHAPSAFLGRRRCYTLTDGERVTLPPPLDGTCAERQSLTVQTQDRHLHKVEYLDDTKICIQTVGQTYRARTTVIDFSE